MRQVFEVHLVHDTRIGRHRPEVPESGLTPAEQRISFLIALKFEQGVDAEGLLGPELIHLHGVVDDEIHRDQRIREFRIGAHGLKCVAHDCQINDAWHAGEILEQHARGPELNFLQGPGDSPAGHILDVRRPHRAVVFKPQEILKKNFDAVRDAVDTRDTSLFECLQAINLVLLISHLKR